MMNDMALDEKIRGAFEWLIERTPPLEDEPVRPISAPVAHRTHTQTLWGAVIAAAAVVVLIGLPLLIRSATTSPSTPPPPTTTSADLPPLALGGHYVWPATPLDGSPRDVAKAFAEEVLGWEGADVTEEFAEPGQQDFLIKHRYASEPLLVSLMVSGHSWVYRVSPISLTTSEPGQEFRNLPLSFTTGESIVGIRVDVPVVAGAVGAELSIQLVGGGQIVSWVDFHGNTDDWIAIDVPDVDRPVVSILIRYVDNGRVISAVAGLFFGEG